ncbi:MAG: hypothetical protein H6793_00255 [Candidatus Nomurabacteria bacterium]|nr:MAG: hypothetical protein H6793_00255 [Candidatus Nomurabacteria bacterium]
MVKNNRYHTRYTSSNNTNNRTSIIPLAKELGFALFLLATVLIFSPKSADAATFNVATGSSATNADSICQLEEAIANINDGTRTNADCIETGAYGTDDTINLPVGTIDGSLSGSGLALLNNSTKIIGQGRGVSVVDDLAIGLFGNGTGVLEVSNLTMTGGGEGVGIGGIEADVTVNNVDIDLEGTGTTAIYTENSNLTVRDSYLHNSDMSGSGMSLMVATVMGGSGSRTVNIDRTTFADGPAGLMIQAGSGFTLNANVKNSTFTDLHGDANSMYQSGAGIGLFLGNNASNQINYITINNTFSNITNTVAGSYPATAIFEYAEDGTITHTAQNDLYTVGDGTANAVNYYRYTGSGSGTPTFTINSNGGNISSDNSFSTYLTQSSDKHNQTSLASFLGVLTDNGGEVPTLALQEGSPAINAGTTVSGMTTDARGVARPQGGAFDAGAYELAMSNPDPDPESGSSAVINNPNGSGTISLTGNPTIPKRPTFSGTTTPNSTVSVTVHSDPVVCTATADSSGNWSCTLPSDLAPGTHTVTIQITKPDSSTETLGPYSVVVTEGQATTITSNDKLANTGQNTIAVALVGSLLVLATSTLAILKKFKRQKKFVG